MRAFLIIVALASMLVALPFSAFAQRGHGGPSRLEGAPPIEERTPPEEERTPPQEERAGTQTFGGRDYHVNSLGGTVAGAKQCAMVGTAGGGMWAGFGISIRNRPKVRPTTCLTLR